MKEQIGIFFYRPLDRNSAREIVGWRYAAPYDVYNCDPLGLEETVAWYVDPQNRYYVVRDEAGELIGFRCFGHDAQVLGGDYTAPALDMGGGLRPDKTGQGLGKAFMESAIVFAQRHFAPAALRVTVAAFNERALRVCHKVGYRPVSTFEATHNGRPFVILRREFDFDTKNTNDTHEAHE